MSQRNTRTKKSIKNAVVSTTYYLIILLLSFFSRRLFFEYLGSEVLGLNATAQDMFAILNLSELGIGSAVAFLLYKPLFEKDTKHIKEIISVQGWLYRKIALFIIIASCVLMCFFPLIFAKSSLPLGYAYILFSVILTGAVISYFFNYRQILLNADQKNYKIQRITMGVEALKIIVQMVVVTQIRNPFFWWVGAELCSKILCAILLDRLIKKEYPWLELQIAEGKELNKQHPEIIKKTKQIFFHKIAGVAMSNSSSPILYAFTSLTTVAFYGNYQVVLTKLTNLTKNLFSSTVAAIGDLVAEGDKKAEKRVFWELLDSKMLIAGIMVICMYYLTQPFISSWLSADYLLGTNFLTIYLVMQGIQLTRGTVDSFISAHGMYQDIWAPITEACLNIGLSILFGYLWGLEGIILGVTVSLIIIVEIWKPCFLFIYGLKESPLPYFARIAGRWAVIIGVAFICGKIIPLLPFHEEAGSSIFKWGIFAIETACVVSLILFPIFLTFSKGLRAFLKRMRSVAADIRPGRH